ncbi:MAG TPA: secretion protein HlyD [Stellaceae bacterium]|nr:secretion protein HlyD [Stellaceae bacterium]
MRRRILVAIALAIVAAGGWAAYTYLYVPRERGSGDLVLLGNVDVRQVELSFKVAGRIMDMKVDEGDRVAAGQTIATLDKRYFDDELRIARARESAQEANLAKLEHGSRPEEIEQARANVELARTAAENNKVTLDRQTNLLKSAVTSQQNYDAALAAARQAQAQLAFAQQALKLAELGPRQEDIDTARAQLSLERANVEVAERNLDDAELIAPSAGTITTRVHEPGAIVASGETVYALTLDNPVWVRAYVGEPDLGSVHPGMIAAVTTDLAGGRTYRGTVGFMSPVAEFTPKSVETRELRTDLVYRLRVIVEDADDGLRQGMPVTVTFAGAARG